MRKSVAKIISVNPPTHPHTELSISISAIKKEKSLHRWVCVSLTDRESFVETIIQKSEFCAPKEKIVLEQFGSFSFYLPLLVGEFWLLRMDPCRISKAAGIPVINRSKSSSVISCRCADDARNRRKNMPGINHRGLNIQTNLSLSSIQL